jgi:hypothetical protein
MSGPMYTPFPKIVIRTPLFSVNKTNLSGCIENPDFREAIYIASPVLYDEMQKYLKGEITEAGERGRIESSLYRYLSRMTTRSTPFGLFAGCTVGNIDEETKIILTGTFNKHTRLDMLFLCTLSQELSKIPEIRNKVNYYPNSSIYPVGNKLRYVEYMYRKNERIHRISSVYNSGYLKEILRKAAKGCKLDVLLKYLTDNDIPDVDAGNFVNQLVESQLLESELTPSVTGEDYFGKIINILDGYNIQGKTVAALKEIQKNLSETNISGFDDFIIRNNINTCGQRNQYPI